MNKLELVTAFKNETELNKNEADTIVNLFFSNMADALINGDRVEIRGLCSFYVKQYKSYMGRNPKTGIKVDSAEDYRYTTITSERFCFLSTTGLRVRAELRAPAAGVAVCCHRNRLWR